MLERVPAPALVLGAVASVQVGSAIAKGLFDELGSTGVVVLRLALAALILTAVTRPRVHRWSRQQWAAAAVLGLTMAAMNGAFYMSLETVPLGIAVTVEFIGPLTLSLVQSRRLTDVLWAVLAMAGVALLGVDTTSGVPLAGLMLALFAGFCWAGYILASARVGQVLPGVDGLAVALAVGAVLVAPVGGADALAAFSAPSLLLGVLAVAVMSSAVPYGLELSALRRLPTRVFGILMSLEPAAAAIAGLIILGQALGPPEVTALVLVSLASAGVTLGRREDQPPAQPLD